MPNTSPIGLGWTAQQALAGPSPVTNQAVLPWAATTAFTLGQVVTNAVGDVFQVTAAGTTAGSAPTWPTALVRQDQATVSYQSSVVLDASIVASDNGRPVTGPGIPANSYVGTVSAGVSFLLSSSPASQVAVLATLSQGGPVVITLLKPTGPTGNTVVDGTVTWQLIGNKFYDAYKVKGADGQSTPTRFDLTINQKPA
jgi:hypothetical protein